MTMSKTDADTKKPRHASAKKHTIKKKEKEESEWVPSFNVKVPNICEGCNTGRWTKEESLLFLYAVKAMGHGKGTWRKIGLFVPTRSKVQVRTHAQKVFQKKKQGADIFAPLRQNRKLAKYLVEQLTVMAKDILNNTKAARDMDSRVAASGDGYRADF